MLCFHSRASIHRPHSLVLAKSHEFLSISPSAWPLPVSHVSHSLATPRQVLSNLPSTCFILFSINSGHNPWKQKFYIKNGGGEVASWFKSIRSSSAIMGTSRYDGHVAKEINIWAIWNADFQSWLCFLYETDIALFNIFQIFSSSSFRTKTSVLICSP